MIGQEWQPILMLGNADWHRKFSESFAMAEKKFGKGTFLISQPHWNNRLQDNPAIKWFGIQVLKNNALENKALARVTSPNSLSTILIPMHYFSDGEIDFFIDVKGFVARNF